MSPKSLAIAVLLEEVQLSDITTIDMFGLLSTDTIGQMAKADPQFEPLLAQAIDVTFHLVSSTLEPFNVSCGMKILPTVTYDTCPRDLDIVLIGGPFPTHRPEASLRFMREAWPRTRVFMTACTGSVWLSASGLLDGLPATTNRMYLPVVKQIAPSVDWKDQRWVVTPKKYDGEGKGELWTAGGAGAGIDMVATYCLKNFGEQFVERAALLPLDMTLKEGHGQFYTI